MTRATALPAAARAIVGGDRRALARVLTAVENGDPSSVPIVRALYPRTGRAPVVGFTGPLGVGKSSVINALVAHLRARGESVGILAVDPSSPFSGGSVLGDRIRLERKADDPDVFFRSMASRGESGGVAATTREAARLLDAAGFDHVLIETVGSGQVDVAIQEIASTSVVVLVPHLGDEIQTLKAGMFEIADVFCVNKSDLPGADVAKRDLSDLVALGASRDGWAPAIVSTSTAERTGIEELWSAVLSHERFLETSGRRTAEERRRLAHEIVGLVRERVGEELTAELERDPALRRLLDEVVARSIDPRTAANRLYAGRGPRRRRGR
jgi:LAO/AO transport system kinase